MNTKGTFLLLAAFVTIFLLMNISYAVLPPRVTTTAATTNINSIRFYGYINATGGQAADLRGFDWGTSPGVYSNNWTQGTSGSYLYSTGPFNYLLSSLPSGTTYYYRAKAHNSAGWAYGNERSASTLATLAVTTAGTALGKVTSSPSGINCGANYFTCAKQFSGGTSVTLTATPVGNFVFAGWSGDCSGTTPTCTITMDAKKSVTATFNLLGIAQILRPNANGDLIQFSQEPTSGAHWDKVDEAVADNEVTYIYTQVAGGTTERVDLFRYPSTTSSDTINSVTVFYVVYSNYIDANFFTELKTGGTLYTEGKGPIVYSTQWKTFSTTYTGNPGGGSWTWSQLNTIQAGVGAYLDSSGYIAAVTQVYVMIDYSPPFDFSISAIPTSGTASAGNSVSSTITSTITLGTTQPVIFSASGLPSGATASFSPTSCNPTCSSTMTIATSPSTPLGTYSIIVNASSGVTKTLTYTLTVSSSDITPPTGNISINSGDAYTKTTSVTLTLTCTDASGCSYMKISNDNSTWSTPEVYSTNKTWTLTTGDGTKTVYARFNDTIGNWMATSVSDSIILDTTAPTITNISYSPLEITVDTDVTTNVQSTDSTSGLSYIKIFVDSLLKQTCVSSPCLYTSRYSDGLHNYHADVVDNAGNIISSSSYSFRVGASEVISIKSGWNLMSIPYKIFNFVSTTCDSGRNFYNYNPSTRTWAIIKDIRDLTGAKGYWVYSDKACTISITGQDTDKILSSDINLQTGWNHIGSTGSESTFNSIKKGCTLNKILSYDTLTQSWQILSATDSIQLYKAYFIKATC